MSLVMTEFVNFFISDIGVPYACRFKIQRMFHILPILCPQL